MVYSLYASQQKGSLIISQTVKNRQLSTPVKTPNIYYLCRPPVKNGQVAVIMAQKYFLHHI
jgi:hypothetical protein